MSRYKRFALGKLVSIGPKFPLFAMVVTKDKPLPRLRPQSLFQMTFGMALELMQPFGGQGLQLTFDADRLALINRWSAADTDL